MRGPNPRDRIAAIGALNEMGWPERPGTVPDLHNVETIRGRAS
jgi:hypothetical protein